MAMANNLPTQHRISPSFGARVHNWAWVWKVTPDPLWTTLEKILRFADALQTESRSLCGRIGRLLSKSDAVVLGPEYVLLLDRSSVRNIRTAARKHGIEELARRNPWASTVDLQIFLEGFDLGEQYARDSLDIVDTTLVSQTLPSMPNATPKV